VIIVRPGNNILIVDDDRSWRNFYEEEVNQLDTSLIRTAASLDEATEAIASLRFAVAVIDIGLREDDRNIDGLEVMKRIRSTGDPTSIIVVTGREGRDVLPLVRDSIKKYDAHDTIAKSTLRPDVLRELIQSGIRAYEQNTADERAMLYAALRGDNDQLIWDDQMMRTAGISGGAAGLYKFVQDLFGMFVPLLPGQPNGIQPRDDICCGIFWSRSIGKAIAAFFGKENRIQEMEQDAKRSGRVIGIYSFKEVLRECSHGATRGLIYTLADYARDDFSSHI
jgi:CheY-like chemotaxis protein